MGTSPSQSHGPDTKIKNVLHGSKILRGSQWLNIWHDLRDIVLSPGTVGRYLSSHDLGTNVLLPSGI